ncbi:MAG: valine--tRNA ligase [Anaerolineae bacterium]|nr:valine--tRNA ligase [Anaerolineae bacterium]
MSLPKRYNPRTQEPELDALWQEQGVYHFAPDGDAPVYAIDTPPATVSGKLHLGHTYSYSQTDFLARFWRMMGHNVFYPMGYDDNGLPTERLVERLEGISAAQVGRETFSERCRAIGSEAGREYRALWQRLGLSVDWRYAYRTIDHSTVRISQQSFLDLTHKGLIYHQRAPAIWCPTCRTAIAQAELNDLERQSTFYTVVFLLPPDNDSMAAAQQLDGVWGDTDARRLPVATTRPELLPACVALFVHPDDARYHHLIGRQANVPIANRWVPILADPRADPAKGTGIVMCCTFGDQTDVEWQRAYNLPLVEALAPDGTMTTLCGELAGLPTAQARTRVVQTLREYGLIWDEQPVAQSVRVHERCDTPVEYILTGQWFIRVLDFKEQLIQAGEQIDWHPAYMKTRYRQWVENLNWDWCISRQRAFGVPFPLWHCPSCGQIVLAQEDELPVDPLYDRPCRSCPCGSTALQPETDVMDTWATSSLTPQIVGQWLDNPDLYRRVFPMSLRPQAHDIIRTWAFYTIVKSWHHFGVVPWKSIAISGWGIAGEGMGKISKSRGGGPMSPLEMIAKYSADAVRYWAASTGLGKDAVISEDKIALGQKLANKLWNVARFSEPFLHDCRPDKMPATLSPADRWILSRTQHLIETATQFMQQYDYAAAKSEMENFFWTELADNYLEMAKLRLYNESDPGRAGARWTLYHTLLTMLKLFAPFLPYVTEAIYRHLFAAADTVSIHTARWPVADSAPSDGELCSDEAEAHGEILCQIATAVRRYKSEHSLPLGSELAQLSLSVSDQALAEMLGAAQADLVSITRARIVRIVKAPDRASDASLPEWGIEIAIDGA